MRKAPPGKRFAGLIQRKSTGEHPSTPSPTSSHCHGPQGHRGALQDQPRAGADPAAGHSTISISRANTCEQDGRARPSPLGRGAAAKKGHFFTAHKASGRGKLQRHRNSKATLFAPELLCAIMCTQDSLKPSEAGGQRSSEG